MTILAIITTITIVTINTVITMITIITIIAILAIIITVISFLFLLSTIILLKGKASSALGADGFEQQLLPSPSNHAGRRADKTSLVLKGEMSTMSLRV